MTVSIPLEIQRRTGLDAASTTRLRTFDLEWRCGTQFVFKLLEGGHAPEAIGTALMEVLLTYQRLCREGVSDFIRLRVVLEHVLRGLALHGEAPLAERVRLWCEAANVPAPIREVLVHG